MIKIATLQKINSITNMQVITISLKDFRHSLEDNTEKLLYASRWVLSPMYILLIVVLILILIKFVGDVTRFISIMGTLTDNEWIVQVLELLDLTLVANLVLIVAFSGYENFISKIDVADSHIDRPSWMGRLDFSGLKLKIIGSVVAISLIELLQDFLNTTSNIDPNVEFWRIALHLTFVATGLVFAGMEILSEKRHEMKNKDQFSELENDF
ncbi:YqhA family protein [uncultured Methanobrevibacter sp.]|uniref:YqhA family protein n=1 Tax=uncultured Methanobrevibacter sp. TaxID=253161 RepID=UPI0025D135B9|nr:YqhA family protein [uncultured Methanobrevibacter sp.]